MATIGGITFNSLNREAQPVAEEVETLTRPGHDGTALRLLGNRGGVTQFIGEVDVVDKAARATLIADSKALAGELVTIVDEFGTTWTLVAVLQVRVQRSKLVGNHVGGQHGTAATIIVWIEFTCTDTNTSPVP